ncbi:MAG TPA: hypothetical protein VHX68_18845 [Planctomycetaceae bacterium]|jgi:hypothetical protein|nr:hypothetical protein [Planctomycetaceae bacterium]
MSRHRIQLRGPWQLEWTSEGGESAEKIRLPVEWDELFSGRVGRVCLTRKFHRPTNLGPNEQVDLLFEQWPGVWIVSLNHHRVGEVRDASSESPERITITASLESTNVLAAETQIEQPADPLLRRGLMGKVALEIRSDDE